MLRADALRCPDDGATSLVTETLPPGTRLGVYRIERVLGDGGMGFVYEATHEVLKRRTAIKMLRQEMAQHPQIVTRFINEAKAANLINHDNIVSVYDSGNATDGSVYFVMEYLEGETLDVLMRKRRPMQVPLLLHLFRQITRALGAAHGKQIVHRDLKPANVFVIAREGNPYFVKLLDFGIAQLRGAGAVQGLTIAGSVMGTPQYMSPEQVTGGEVDTRSDVWALGVMLYKAATGEAPFLGEEFAELAPKILYQPPRPPGELVQMPSSLSELIMSCLAREKAARCPSMEALLGGLDRVMREAGLDEDSVMDAVMSDSGAMAELPPVRVQKTNDAVAASQKQFQVGILPPQAQVAAASGARRSTAMLAMAGAAVLALGVGGGYLVMSRGKASAEVPPGPTEDAGTPLPPGPREIAVEAESLTDAFKKDGITGAREVAKRQLEGALAAATLQERGFAIDAIAEARVAGAGPLLFRSIESGEAALLEKATAATVALRVRSASPKLRAAFSRTTGGLQVKLAAAMVLLGDKDALASLRDALRDKGVPAAIAMQAASALAEAGDSTGLATFVSALESAEGSSLWRGGATGLLRLGDARGKKALLGELARPEAARAIEAAVALAQSGEDSGVRELAARLADAEFGERGRAAAELARLGDARALSFVPEGLASDKIEDRLGALAVCGALPTRVATHIADIVRIADSDAEPRARLLAKAVILGL